VPWRYAAVAATAALAAGIFYDFWTPNVFVAAQDIFTQEYLRWEWGWAALFRYGRAPLWNPYLFGGFPFISTFGFCPFYPPAWPLALLPTALAITMRFVLGLALGGLGFYAFARATRLAPPRALLAALLYESGSHVITLAFPGHLDKVLAIGIRYARTHDHSTMAVATGSATVSTKPAGGMSIYAILRSWPSIVKGRKLT